MKPDPDYTNVIGHTHLRLDYLGYGRQANKDEGLHFLEEMQRSKLTRPLVFYTIYAPETWKKARAAFGITNRPDQLLHYVIDLLERERI